MQPACKHLAVIEQVLEPRAQQQMSPILVRLHQHGQEKIAALFRHLFGTQNLETLREIDHLGDRGRLFERVVAEGKSDSGNATMEAAAGVRGAAGDDLRFALRCRMFDTDVETAATDRIAQPALFVTGQDDEGGAAGRNGAKLGLPDLLYQ
jgi:hypothetical protein